MGGVATEQSQDGGGVVHHTAHQPHLHLPHLHRSRARNVNALAEERLMLGQRVADRVAATMGSWRFIITQSVVLACWIALNVAGFVRHWDPYPFILLNLALSFQAAYAAPIIMMSQNRQAAKDRLQADEDFRLDVLAEQQIAAIQAKLERWDALCAAQEEQLALLREIRDALAGNANTPASRA